LGSSVRRIPAHVAFPLALATLLVIGLLIRLPLLTIASSSYRWTDAYNFEEVENVRISTGMLHKHALNPHAFEYPSLFYYLSLGLETALERLGRGGWTRDLLGVRALSLAFGLGTILAASLLARRIAGDAAGIAAAAIVACDGTLIDISGLAKPNATQVFFFTTAFILLARLATDRRVATACGAAALFAFAAASKWLGALGLAGLLIAPALAVPAAGRDGVSKLMATLAEGARRPVAAWRLALPIVVFFAALLGCMPYAILSPREFGFGLAQTLTAQALHRRALPPWAPLGFLGRSIGPLAAVLAVIALLWALARVRRWSGSAHDRGLVLVLAWAVGYGLLLSFAFVRLASYVDLWVPFVAVLVACAWAGEEGLIRSSGLRWALAGALLVAGIASHGADALARSIAVARFDTRVASGSWLERFAADSDAVVADLGAYVPDRLRRVEWIDWGSPPRIVYDESVTWGSDPIWPEWNGGHRRLVFENVKWRPALELLATRPRWILTLDEWRAIRSHPEIQSETPAPDYDRSLADGSTGYVLRARFAAEPAPSPWRVVRARTDARADSALYRGPAISIFERVR